MFEPKHFLDFSKCLLEDKLVTKNEAYYRSIISRSYYSSLLTARETIDNFNDEIIDRENKESSHKNIISKVTRLPIQKVNIIQLQIVQKHLQELQIYRINADYKFKDAKHPYENEFLKIKKGKLRKVELNPETEQSAEFVVKKAEKIIETLNKV